MPKDFGNTQDLVDISEIRENTIILRSGGLRQIVMVGGINFSLRSEDEQNIVTSSYQNFLNGIDFPMQIVIHSRKVNIERYLESLAQQSLQETSPLLQNQGEEYREYIRGFVQKNAIMEKTFLIVVPFYPLKVPTQASVGNILPFGGKNSKSAASERARESAELSFRDNLQQLKQRVNQVVEGLFAMGLEAVVLNDEQLIELFYNFYNPETVEKEGVNLSERR